MIFMTMQICIALAGKNLGIKISFGGTDENIHHDRFGGRERGIGI